MPFVAFVAVATLAADSSQNAANCTDYNYGSDNATAPDLCWVRGRHVKMGIGVSVEQSLAHDIGVNLRAMKSDGRTEVDAFESADSSAALALLVVQIVGDAAGAAQGFSRRARRGELGRQVFSLLNVQVGVPPFLKWAMYGSTWSEGSVIWLRS